MSDFEVQQPKEHPIQTGRDKEREELVAKINNKLKQQQLKEEIKKEQNKFPLKPTGAFTFGTANDHPYANRKENPQSKNEPLKSHEISEKKGIEYEILVRQGVTSQNHNTLGELQALFPISKKEEWKGLADFTFFRASPIHEHTSNTDGHGAAKTTEEPHSSPLVEKPNATSEKAYTGMLGLVKIFHDGTIQIGGAAGASYSREKGGLSPEFLLTGRAKIGKGFNINGFLAGPGDRADRINISKDIGSKVKAGVGVDSLHGNKVVVEGIFKITRSETPDGRLIFTFSPQNRSVSVGFQMTIGSKHENKEH